MQHNHANHGDSFSLGLRLHYQAARVGGVKMSHRFVVTGGPGSGKTTLLDALAERGYRVVPESARSIIKGLLPAH